MERDSSELPQPKLVKCGDHPRRENNQKRPYRMVNRQPKDMSFADEENGLKEGLPGTHSFHWNSRKLSF